jgi:hypothetical protein
MVRCLSKRPVTPKWTTGALTIVVRFSRRPLATAATASPNASRPAEPRDQPSDRTFSGVFPRSIRPWRHPPLGLIWSTGMHCLARTVLLDDSLCHGCQRSSRSAVESCGGRSPSSKGGWLQESRLLCLAAFVEPAPDCSDSCAARRSSRKSPSVVGVARPAPKGSVAHASGWYRLRSIRRADHLPTE